jgi:hypothetical protein
MYCEPFLDYKNAKFEKFTDAFEYKKINEEILTSFSHFSFEISSGYLLIVDL